ncbi:hypothetical protein PPERSA_02001 [Pseudocohnilembus persalinus]|uniref:Cation/H+ exchanger transmembrane domain-containing protein n=1 Tax=Pseudocohnilembus persalinus TaxID=266149 RepID=A0A0V0QF58_PSEPJ|nr:hypothetical protein PPERSA_02001 [Pseudocohnilembus persalinus]|eukprot:KRX00822.1 hypothetical protein PPERSA_02001 [Pseudocohnilembus persalinus]
MIIFILLFKNKKKYLEKVDQFLIKNKKITFIHITGLGLIIGFVVGLIFNLITKGEYAEDTSAFDSNIFFYVILPPIIYAGGYGLDTRRFTYGFYYTLVYGVLGTVVSFGVTAVVTFIFDDLEFVKTTEGVQVRLLNSDILLFSACMSSTDAIAALTMIDPNKYPKLFSVIFGEGMVNDAVSIVIYLAVFDLVGDLDNPQKFHWYTSFEILGNFFIILFGSLGIGLAFGILSTLIMKKCRFLTENPIVEVSTVFLFGYTAFIICQKINFSGVLAILVCGIFQSHYCSKNLSVTGKVSTKISIEFLSLVAEAFLYIFIGISSWEYDGPFTSAEDHVELPWSWQLVVFEVLACFFSRFFGIFVLSWIFSIIKGRRKWQLNRWEIGIIYMAGIIRGAIAYALVQTIPGDGLSQEITKSTVFFIVVITTLGMGSFIPLWIKFSLNQIQNSERYGPDHPSIKDPLSEADELKKSIREDLLEEEEIKEKENRAFKLENWFHRMDRNYFLRWFVFDYEQKALELEEEEIALKSIGFRNQSIANSSGYRSGSLFSQLRDKNETRSQLRAQSQLKNRKNQSEIKESDLEGK